MNKNKRPFLMLCLLLAAMTVMAQTAAEWKALKSDVNFFLVNDMGRNG